MRLVFLDVFCGGLYDRNDMVLGWCVYLWESGGELRIAEVFWTMNLTASFLSRGLKWPSMGCVHG